MGASIPAYCTSTLAIMERKLGHPSLHVLTLGVLLEMRTLGMCLFTPHVDHFPPASWRYQ